MQAASATNSDCNSGAVVLYNRRIGVEVWLASPGGGGQSPRESPSRNITVTPRTWLSAMGLGLACTAWAGVERSGGLPTDEPPSTTIYLKPYQADALRPAAQELAAHLKECSRLDFKIESLKPFTGTGIVLRLAEFLPNGPTAPNPESLTVIGTPHSVEISGNSPLAVEEAVFFYLEQLGFRCYFPHPAWRIMPRTRQLFGTFSVVAEPDYASRRISQNGGTGSKKADADFAYWEKANRMGGAMHVATGHAWDGIIARNKAEFERHPEYLARLPPEIAQRQQTRGKKGNNKFCCSNEGLIQLCIRDALQRLATPAPAARARAELDEADDDAASDAATMISMDPSDGAGACTCANCRKLGGTTEQIFYLANRVAKAVREKYPEAKVGLYAYYEHAAPPAFPLESNVFVQIATALNASPYTVDQLFDLWGRKLPRIGVREYFGVMAWDHDMPGRGNRASRLDYIEQIIPRFHRSGAVTFQAQSTVGWMSRGLGQYVATRLLWDVNASVPAITNEFFTVCFGQAARPIAELFARWQYNPNKLPLDHDLAVWLRLVDEATHLEERIDVQERLEQIKLYLHYIALHKRYEAADRETGDDWFKTYLATLTYMWRVRDLGVCAAWPYIRSLARGRAPSAEVSIRNPRAPWKHDAPILPEELDRWMAEDRAEFKELTWLQPAAYYDSAFRLLPVPETPGHELRLRMKHEVIVAIQGGGPAAFAVSFGQIKNDGKTGSVRVYRLDQNPDEEAEEPLISREIPMDQKDVDVGLSALGPGMYRMLVDDHAKGWVMRPGKDVGYALRADAERQLRTLTPNDFCFYVPSGTARFATVHRSPVTLKAPGGRLLKFADKSEQLDEVEVRPGETGFWQAINQSSVFYLIGVPPYVAATPCQLLVPWNAAWESALP